MPRFPDIDLSNGADLCCSLEATATASCRQVRVLLLPGSIYWETSRPKSHTKIHSSVETLQESKYLVYVKSCYKSTRQSKGPNRETENYIKITVRAGSYSSVVKGLLNLHRIPESQKKNSDNKKWTATVWWPEWGKMKRSYSYTIHNYMNFIIKQLF